MWCWWRNRLAKGRWFLRIQGKPAAFSGGEYVSTLARPAPGPGFNPKQLAALLKMSQTGYSKYETGENDVPTWVLIRLAELYRTSVDYLLGLTDQPRPYPRKGRGSRENGES